MFPRNVVLRSSLCTHLNFCSVKFVSHRNVRQILKSLDEQKFSSFEALFAEEVLNKRSTLAKTIDDILLADFESIGKKNREILWRKVYYDNISAAKKLWRQDPSCHKGSDVQKLITFIEGGITHYKTLILKFEDTFSLDIRFIIDFAIIANGASAFDKKLEKEIYTVNEISHALDCIHSFLICLGDLHRYCIELNSEVNDVTTNASKDLAFKYYSEAFKLNPKMGMPQNQMGTLCAAQNFEIDSIFHYIYSLCCPIPFALSETNVNRIFQQNSSKALENLESEGFIIKDFMMQVILVIDIFFFDKEVEDFNTLCRTVLLGFKAYLNQSKIVAQFDVSFQLTSILMLCLLKLRLNNSPKVHSLVAFLVAFCAEIAQTLLAKIDKFVVAHEEENSKFVDAYNKKFMIFENGVKHTHERNVCSESTDEPVPNHTEKLSVDSKPTSDERSVPASPIILKKAAPNVANRRRRKRARGTGSSDSSSNESETESLGNDSDKSASMNSDFDSYDEQDDFSDHLSSDDEHEHENNKAKKDTDDVIIENEELIFNPISGKTESNGRESSVDDFVIEEEREVFPESEADKMTYRKKFKKRYAKTDPNLILNFSMSNNGLMKSLKILLDWLHLNQEILLSCYRSNPEFITKIMDLINFLNIDIFTRKIYFDRSLITLDNVRENMRHLFDIRHQIATSEDVVFKKCLMFEEIQCSLDWELSSKLHLSHEEDVVLRNFKIIDFGFHICKMKKFGYNFCSRSRVFIEKCRRRRNRRSEGKKAPRRRRERRKNRVHKRENSDCEVFQRLAIQKHVEEYPSIEQSERNFRKGYLNSKTNKKGDKENEVQEEKTCETVRQVDKKNELMGKLWLKSEIKSLESKKHSSVALTPYIMLDSTCLTDFLSIVKNLVKSKKFILLIPKAGKLKHFEHFRCHF